MKQKIKRVYIKYITTNTPFVILKIAMTLDGKIATPSGESKWITSEKSRKLVHIMRGRVDAILSAYGTVLRIILYLQPESKVLKILLEL